MNRNIFVLLLSSLLMLAEASTPPKQWQSGKVRDAQSGQYDVAAPPNGGALTRVASVLKSHSYTDYVIESEKYVFVVELKGKAHVIVNDTTKFATEKETLWFIDADGKERKTKILKQTLKDPPK